MNNESQIGIVMSTVIYVSLFLVGASVILLNQTGFLPDESPIEEGTEVVIEHVFGLPVDLSPGGDDDDL